MYQIIENNLPVNSLAVNVWSPMPEPCYQQYHVVSNHTQLGPWYTGNVDTDRTFDQLEAFTKLYFDK